MIDRSVNIVSRRRIWKVESIHRLIWGAVFAWEDKHWNQRDGYRRYADI